MDKKGQPTRVRERQGGFHPERSAGPTLQRGRRGNGRFETREAGPASPNWDVPLEMSPVCAAEAVRSSQGSAHS